MDAGLSESVLHRTDVLCPAIGECYDVLLLLDASLEPLVSAGVRFSSDAVAGKTLYLIIDYAGDTDHSKMVDANLTLNYITYVPM